MTRPVTAQGRRITLALDFAFPGSAARGRERRRAPDERSQVDGEQIVDVRTEEFRVGLRERLAVRRSGKLTVTPRPKERGQLRIQQERRDPFPPIIDAAPPRVREPRIREKLVDPGAHPIPSVLPGRRRERMRAIGRRQARQQEQQQTMTGPHA